ncbi:hypothetical protein G7Y89_g4339 [Cudoniella acicularis]|uniref:Uncharacterized protein n=1 Tax=Cudoniella acicularis TaxID=354080 RepID=A0A8H4W540_9HELO|nr:hypothetical protein G7Y89_g4339 [Cudoniella acicularis]
MARKIYLLTFPTRASKINGTRAHWGLFIPTSTPQDSEKGKLIQVVGTPFTGFGLEFRRNYDLTILIEKYQLHLLGEMEDRHVEDVIGDGRPGIDITPHDDVEKEAKRLDPPGVSKEPLNPAVTRCCQEWTRDLVDRLIVRKILPKEASLVLDEAKALEIGA